MGLLSLWSPSKASAKPANAAKTGTAPATVDASEAGTKVTPVQEGEAQRAPAAAELGTEATTEEVVYAQVEELSGVQRTGDTQAIPAKEMAKTSESVAAPPTDDPSASYNLPVSVDLPTSSDSHEAASIVPETSSMDAAATPAPAPPSPVTTAEVTSASVAETSAAMDSTTEPSGPGTDIVVAIAPASEPTHNEATPLTSEAPAQSETPASTPMQVSGSEATTNSAAADSQASDSSAPKETLASPNRRFSMKSFSAWYADRNTSKAELQKPVLSSVHEHERREHAKQAAIKHHVRTSASDKKAKEYALVVRSLIVGPTGVSVPKGAVVTKVQLSKVKSHLIEPKTANRVIAQLRDLPMVEVTPVTGAPADAKVETAVKGHGPIHAVCMPYTDEEAHERKFSRLHDKEVQKIDAEASAQNLLGIPSIATATLVAASRMFEDLNLVDLVMAPNMGLGAPGDAPGLFSGAIPTAETVINGINQITPQLMSLGYAMGKSVEVDHAGVNVPTDRMSILTYWWGLEVALPPPSIQYLTNAPSISHAIINFLTAMSVANSGVREVLPFVRYISQYVDFEFSAIQKVDEGQGVVCAATWIMPAAMVPRAWDFPPPTATTNITHSQPTADVNKTSTSPARETAEGSSEPFALAGVAIESAPTTTSPSAGPAPVDPAMA